jgi:hypothetical protein
MTHEKVKSITDWPDPLTPKDMRSFVGLTGVYRKFVPEFARISAPLLDLILVDQKEYNKAMTDERWPKVLKAIDFLKAAMITRPALALPEKGNYDYLVRTDASDFAIGATLRQMQKTEANGMVDRIIAYFSRKLHDAETRYSTYDKELLGIHDAVDHWKYYLRNGHKFRVQTDHSALQHVLGQPRLTSRQMRLLQTLQDYDFDIEYYPGAKNYIQDALSRRADYKDPPIQGRQSAMRRMDERLGLKSRDEVTIQKKEEIGEEEIQEKDRVNPVVYAAAAEESAELLLSSGLEADEWMERLKSEYRACPYFRDVLMALGGMEDLEETQEKKRQRAKRARQFELSDGLIRQRATGKLGIPTVLRQEVLQEAHDSAIGGHFGALRTTALVQKEFYWKGLVQDVKRYVRGCAVCHRAKPSNEKPYGLLQPLEIPRRRWERINVDFITKLPETTASGEGSPYGGNDTIITFIDALTKRAHWVATKEKALTAERFAEIFVESYFRLHGLPEAIVSDRDPRFTGGFWQHLTSLWQTRTKMSTAFHPQTDGQAEKANSIVERYLRSFTAGNERKWDRLLALAEFSYNSHVHKATGMSPFEADLTENPRMPLSVMAGASRGREEEKGSSFATRMNDILAQLTDTLKITQEKMTMEANKSRQPHAFQTGDSVFVNTRNFPLGYANAATDQRTIVDEEKGARLSRTLQQRFMGPYTLGEARGENAFELDFPDHLKVSKTRNVVDFKRNQVDTSEGRIQNPPPPIRVVKKSGQAEYEIERIVSWRKDADSGKAYFEVKWLGYGDADNTFEPHGNITRYGGKTMFLEYVARMDDPELSRLLPKALRPRPEPRRTSRRGG